MAADQLGLTSAVKYIHNTHTVHDYSSINRQNVSDKDGGDDDDDDDDEEEDPSSCLILRLG